MVLSIQCLILLVFFSKIVVSPDTLDLAKTCSLAGHIVKNLNSFAYGKYLI